MRKSVMFAAAALMMVASCSENVWTGSDPKDADAEITFEAPIVSLSTRAVINGTSFPTDQSFMVFGKKFSGDYTFWEDGEDYMFTEQHGNQENPDQIFHNGVEVSYETGATGATSGWRSVEKFYWPKDGGKLAFIAYAPDIVNNLNAPGVNLSPAPDIPCTVSIGDSGLTVNRFDVRFQEDLLYCDPVTNQTVNFAPGGGPAQSVQINFKHALSSVSITAKVTKYDENARIFIYHAGVSSYMLAGDFNQNLPTTEGGNQQSSPVWNARPIDSISHSIEACIAELADESFLDESPRSDLFKDVLMVPHEFKNSYPALSLRYKIYDAQGNFTYGDKYLLLYKIFPEGQRRFEMGKRYIFNIIIDPTRDEITFEPSVEDWEPVTKEVQIVLAK